MKSVSGWVWVALGGLSISFHIMLIFSGLIPNLVSRPLHMALALPWIFIALATHRTALLSGMVLCIPGVLICLWIAFNHAALGDQYGYISGYQ